MTDQDDPGFWSKVFAAWPRKKRGPWENFTYTVAEAAGESLGAAIGDKLASAYDHIAESLNQPGPDTLTHQSTFTDPDDLVAETKRVLRGLARHLPTDDAFRQRSTSATLPTAPATVSTSPIRTFSRSSSTYCRTCSCSARSTTLASQMRS